MSAPDDLRARGLRAAVDALRRDGNLTRSELARRTGVSRPTIASIIEELDRRGLVVEYQDSTTARRAPGRPATLIRLHPSAGTALGISVEREELRVALVDLSLTVLADRSAQFALDTPAETLLELILDLAGEALADGPAERGALIGVGVGLPSPIDLETGDVDARILASWSGRPVRETLAERLGTRVMIENDANLEGLGELTLGAGRGMSGAVYVKVSWGIGGAILLGGELYRGAGGFAGEFAHIQVVEDGDACGCGRRGCLGTVASGHVLRELLEPAHGAPVSLQDIVRLAAAHDTGTLRVLKDSGRAIGSTLAGVCLALNPDAVIAGGELGGTEPFLEGLREGLHDHVLPLTAETTAVVPAQLGKHAGALGGAGLIVRSREALEHVVARL
ncbi:ROK family protein [Solirubrobacter ginsenosidimutans]|uniref:ROK family protein n=1 Tax=Solirubrobacter ginsenosidimutans TaxID=490573 RepID=A0A9X3MUP6_9ACTN|nr:ROK family transcriptional regulator [Solirubrobacter ginsenosidimutans]MDA0161613.1 ROK family protein [Solirubrobacter ginsenosidimutans]